MAKSRRVTPQSLRVGQTVHIWNAFGIRVDSIFVRDNSDRACLLSMMFFGAELFYTVSAALRSRNHAPRWFPARLPYQFEGRYFPEKYRDRVWVRPRFGRPLPLIEDDISQVDDGFYEAATKCLGLPAWALNKEPSHDD